MITPERIPLVQATWASSREALVKEGESNSSNPSDRSL